MRQVEIQAFSVEEAVRLALEQLGRTRDQVKVEVLATDPGSEEVLVRVTADEPRGNVSDEEASPRRSGTPNRGYGPVTLGRTGERRPGGGGPGMGGNQDRGPRPGGDRDRGDRGNRPRNDRGNFGGGGGQGGGNRFDRQPAGWTRSPMRNAERANRGLPVDDTEFDEDDNRGNRIEGGPVGVELDSSLQAPPTESGEHATPEDAVAPIAAEVLQKILQGMRVRGRIVRRLADEEGEAAFPDDQQSLTLNVVGLSERDQNALIGRRAETLDSLQFLVNLIVGRQVDLWTRVIVDIEGYRLRRKFALINLARKTAEQVHNRKQAIPLESMPAYERRIIHMTLSEHPDVTTESAGAEPERRVVVLPK